ncbi:uncharacterized protein MYCFIDRAFT_26635 [Pseudocercospora fijiensis CIRAD86]|uniref:UDENN domain-containing protein n=1 Tax=Pseudocercospora fijiensis (strain CIRAD86) TaxID=383855 RepID=N1Q6F0_PSEFD|nr:uncharacterized protein MYCFIDRAFT_26635 [Pseudocercospora fijiensis CIRAD86]EME87925.1 hypothetical protein MYCFIDRAFT_26635 [Pseudocercospora fijiensis CIRAD86]
MATVLPIRPNTNSTGSSASRRHPSLISFPSHTTSDPSNNLQVNHRHTHSNNSHQSSRNSYHSSLSATNSQPPHARPLHKQPPRRKAKPVKSQYPPDSSEKHVEYILVASFDIDRGSIMEHQYPGPVGGDEHMLAELMLPDQAHSRAQDWTIFFLHKDAGLDDEDQEAVRRRRRRRRKGLAEDEDDEEDAVSGAEFDEDGPQFGEEDDDDESDDVALDGPPLVYVLNLVNTKHDTSVKRGAVVKAMAICTRHSFLHIYKPLLLLALEQYFANPQIETLASLYNAVNSMDLSLLPKLNFLEKYILQATDAKDLFLEKFEAIISQRMTENMAKEGALPPLEQATSTAQLQSKTRYGLPRDTHEFESIVHYANIPVPVKIPTAVSPETVGDFSLIKLITTFSTPHSTQAVPFTPTHPHLTTSGAATHPIIVLLNALLTQKRVIFLGHGLPSSEVAEAVLGACALASGGLLRGFTRHAFPYTDLTKIDDLLKVPGFIAGVTNPAFALKTEWWDLMCNLSTGRMTISNRIEQAPLTEGVAFFHQNTHQPGTIAASNALPTGSMAGDATGDGAFMQSVLSAINERHGETAIRSKFRKWVVKFTRLASSFEETVYGASALHIHNADSPQTTYPASEMSPISPGEQRGEQLPPEVTGHGYVWPTPQSKNNELAANSTRIEGWRNTRSYYNFVRDLAAHYVHRPIKHLDLQHLHDKLAKLRLGHEQSANIYLAICAAVHTEQEISQLLSVVAIGVWENKATTSGSGQNSGLLYIGMGLFHPRQDVREEVAELMGRIREHEAGRHFWSTMGRYIRVGFERVMNARVDRIEKTGVEHDS